MTFDDFSFHEKLLAGIKDMGFVEPTPVQAETFRLVASGKDIEAQSQTGTGKTAAFLIAGFQLMMSDPQFQGHKMLVVAPTRELADQIEKEAQAIGKHLNFRIGAFYGGVGYAQQEKLIADGVDVIIGTPGRLLDFVQSGKLSFRDVGVLVIDEADRLFDMGFYPDLRQMLRTMSNPEDRRTMLFSATLSSQVMNLAWEYLRDPGQIVIEPEHVTVDKITQELYHVGSEEKFALLLGLLNREKPQTAIVFTNTKHTAVRVAKRLNLNGYTTEYIMGDLPQAKRLKIIEDMKAGNLSFLVATDVAARGLHINNLDLVVNYDLPTEAENYVHRIGRTARAGQSGKAISLACEKYVYGLKAIEDYTGVKVPVVWFNEADAVEDKSKGVHIVVDEDDHLPSRRRDGSRGSGRPDRRERTGGRRGPGRERERDRERDTPRPEASGERPERQDRPDRTRGRGKDKPLTIRSSSLVNEATGVKFLKDGMEAPKGEKKEGSNNSNNKDRNRRRSSQGEKIAAAAAAVGKPPKGRDQRKGPGTSAPNASRKPAPKPSKPTKTTSQGTGKKPVRSPELKDRLDYYRSKYGEDFKPVDMAPEKAKKEGVLGKIAGIFGFGKKKKED